MGRLSDCAQSAVTFFGDASSKKSRYMVAGGFAVAAPRIREIENKVSSLRQNAGISEFHWSDYRGGATRESYEALVEYAFGLVSRGHAAFHVIICPFKGYKHNRRSGENEDTSVNRMYFQLLLHRAAQFYGAKRQIHVRLDEGGDSADICRMRNELCAAAYKKYQTLPNCVKSLQPLGSEKSGIIQMADVLLGGIAAALNGVRHKSEKGPLAEKILADSGRRSWEECTPQSARKLTVWNFTSSE